MGKISFFGGERSLVRRDFHFGLFIAFIALIIFLTNPFTSEDKSIALNILSEYNQTNKKIDFQNMTPTEKSDVAEEYVYLAKQLAKYDKYDRALEILKEAIELDPGHENIYSDVGSLYLAKAFYDSNNDTQKAIETGAFQQAVNYGRMNVEKFPGQSRSYDGLINTYVFVEDFDTAINTAKEACFAGPEFKHLCNRTADLYLMQGQRENAINFYKEVSTRFAYANNAWVYRHIGTIYSHQGDCSLASKYFQLAYKTHATSENLEALTSPCYEKTTKY